MTSRTDPPSRMGLWTAIAIAIAITVATVALGGGALAAAHRHTAPAAGEAAREIDESPPAGERAMSEFQHHALNFLLLPLIDDAEPLRWTLQNIAWICDGHGEPSIDGRPISEGQPFPSGPFVLRWRLHRCAPMNDASLIVDGVVDLAIVRSGDRLDAHVVGHSLRTASAAGESRWSGRFAGVAPVTVAGPR